VTINTQVLLYYQLVQTIPDFATFRLWHSHSMHCVFPRILATASTCTWQFSVITWLIIATPRKALISGLQSCLHYRKNLQTRFLGIFSDCSRHFANLSTFSQDLIPIYGPTFPDVFRITRWSSSSCAVVIMSDIIKVHTSANYSNTSEVRWLNKSG